MYCASLAFKRLAKMGFQQAPQQNIQYEEDQSHKDLDVEGVGPDLRLV
jgi:hypothetical protein